MKTRIAAVASLVAILAFLPIKVDPTSSRVVAVNEACGQATSCKKVEDYICSTYNDDYDGYVCYTGCDEGDG